MTMTMTMTMTINTPSPTTTVRVPLSRKPDKGWRKMELEVKEMRLPP